jgi:hypothetical protein
VAFDEAAYQAHIQGLSKGGSFGNSSTAGVSGNPSASAKPVSVGPQIQAPARPNFVKAVATQTFDAGKTLAKSIGSFAVHTPGYIYNDLHPFLQGVANVATRNLQKDLENTARQRKAIDGLYQQTISAYKSGKMSKTNYQKRLLDLGKSYDGLSKDAMKVAKQADRGDVIESSAMTAADILSGGSVAVTKQAGLRVGTGLADRMLAPAVKGIEKVITKIPGGREMLVRHAKGIVKQEAQQMAGETAGQWVARSGKQLAVGLLIKRPIFYQTNIGLAHDTYQHVIDGKYDDATKSAAWIAAQMVGGGPIGWFVKEGKRGLAHIGSLAKGKGSFIDELSSRIGNGNRGQIADLIEKSKMVSKGSVAPEAKGPAYDIPNNPHFQQLAEEARKAKSFDEFANKTYDVPIKHVHGNTPEAANTTGVSRTPNAPVEMYMRQGRPAIDITDGNHRLYAAKARGDETIKAKFNNATKEGAGHWGRLKDFYDEANAQAAQQATIDAERTWRIMQHTNMTAANGKAEVAADNVMAHYFENNIDPSKLTAEQVTQDMAKWAQADELATKTIKQGVIKGIPPEDVSKYAVVRWDRATQEGLAQAIQGTDGSSQAMLDVLNKFADRTGAGWTNNEILMNRLYKLIGSAQSQEEVVKGIKGVSTASTMAKGVPKVVAQQLADLGYTIAAPFGGNKIARVDYDAIDDLHKIVTGAIKGTPLFDEAHAPEPVLADIATLLSKVGLSPESANQVAHQKLSEAVIGNLAELDVAKNLGLRDSAATEGGDFVAGGKAVLNKLQQYVEDMNAGKFARATGLSKVSVGRSAVTDIRQLTNGEIADALHITESEAKNVSKAVRRGYTDVPLEFRGLGDKVVDYAQRIPFSPMRYYLRAQSAMRYTYNPFFRFQEITETKILSQMNADKFLWLTPRAQLNDTVKSLEQAGVFSGRFSGNVAGVDANDNVIGRISANLTQNQKRNLAGLATHVAESQGKTVQEVLRDNPEQIDDALRIIVQYPREGAISSPLARTINLAFFPMRYNIKVATMTAEKLAQLPHSVQYATLVGLHKTREWLKSDEGIQWQSDHNEAIKLFAWATPWGNIQQIANALLGNVPGHGGALSDLGLLGGLPFGFISQLLDAEGIITLNKPYIDLSSGNVFPRSTPATTKAQAAVALESLLGTMFSFPGRTLGLPGKGASIRGLVDHFVNTSGKEYTKQDNMDNLSPLQQNMVRVLSGDTSPQALDSLYTSPAPGQFNYYTIPPMTLPYVTKAINDAKPKQINRSLKLPKAKKTPKALRPKPLPQPIP